MESSTSRWIHRHRGLRCLRKRTFDAGLAKLAGLKTLQSLDVRDTQVTGQGIAALKSALPSLKVIGGAVVPRPPPPK